MSLSLHNIAEATYKWALFNWLKEKFTSVPFSHSVMFNSLKPRGLQHARIPCPSPTPRAYSNWCLSQWWHPTISSSVVSFSSCLQSFPASGSFQWVNSLHQVANHYLRWPDCKPFFSFLGGSCGPLGWWWGLEGRCCAGIPPRHGLAFWEGKQGT